MIAAEIRGVDVERIRADFPILRQTEQGNPLIYLDNSNTSQKPNVVIQALTEYYQKNNANIHRSLYALSERATRAYEDTRKQIKNYLHAEFTEEIIFTKGTTEAINLVAQGLRPLIAAGDEILVSAMEHHSNLVPWQMLAKQVGASLRTFPISDQGEIDLEAYKKLLTSRTKLVAVAHASNVLGTINPIKEMTTIARELDVPVLVDGAQAFPHLAVNVKELDCDFYTFSSHKAYGPTGVGVLYGKKTWLEKMTPYQGGGNMIETVSLTDFTCNQLPYKFEAGTPNIADVIAFSAALNYLQSLGMQHIAAHEHDLLKYAEKQLASFPQLQIFGNAEKKLGVISFVLGDIHAHDIGTILAHEGICVRAGHHCAMPLMERFKVPAMVRVSFGIYNTHAEIDLLISALKKAQRIFS